MNPKALEESYNKSKDKFHIYINNIKKNSTRDIYTIINTTLIKNPYNTSFPKKFFLNLHDVKKENKFFLFIKSTCKFYIKQFYLLFSYLIAFILFKIFYKKNKIEEKKIIFIDIFFLVDNIIKDNKLNENYFKGLYPVLDKLHKNHIFLPRLYGIGKNPFKILKLFKILNKDDRNFLFEFELLSFKDFILISKMIIVYPFKTLRLLQKEKSNEDALFNNELVNDIASVGFDAFSRYIYGKNIAKLNNISIIYSWSEFQVIERSFNFGIRKNNKNINITACQFYLNYETYFNSYIDDIDFDMFSSPHRVLVNGKYYILDRKKLQYNTGVSLRYQSIFDFTGIQSEDNVLLLGSYIENDTKYMLESVKEFDNIIFKNHPAINISKLGALSTNITMSNDNIYTLFKNAKLVIGTASGTLVEAVACGISVIVIASQDNLTANPLIDYGKGKIWDIAFNKDNVKILYNNLISYKENNKEEIENISQWYKENFFIEPTEENIIKAFNLEKGL